MTIIVSDNEHGGVRLTAPATPDDAEQILLCDATAFVVDRSALPDDTRFVDAWTRNGREIVVDMVRVKSIAHGIRRSMRSEQMAQLDIEATIPFLAVAAEEKRQALRDHFNLMQVAIEAAATVGEIALALCANQQPVKTS